MGVHGVELTTTRLEDAAKWAKQSQARARHQLGPQVLAVHVPVRHRVLRHGVHVASPARSTTSRASAPSSRASRRARATC